MKIDLNLSPSQSFRQRHVLAWSLPLFIVCLALLVRLVFTIQTNWSEYRSVGRSVQREQDRRNELAAREAALKRQLDEPQSRALLREVRFVNSVIDERQFSFADMEAKVTALLPPEVRLTALSMPDSAGDPLVHVGVEGSSDAPLETFLINLEDSPDFRDTMITGTGFDEKGNGAPVGISCTARYVSGRGSASDTSAEVKPEESSKLGTEKAGLKPAASQVEPGKASAPKELTTAPKVAAGLAAARANPGVPIKIGAVRRSPVQRGPGQKASTPGQPAPPASAPGRAPAGPTPK